jgi:ABC-type transporter Mla subunit MlaD
MARGSRRPVALATLVLGVIVLYLVLSSGGSDSRTFSAIVPAADDLLDGQELNAGGKAVGKVTGVEPVERGRAARIKLKITDADYWPLPRDSRIEIRFGGTVSFSNRYLLLTRGKDRAHVLADGDALPRGAVKTPVEVDEFFNDFPAPLRRDFRGLIGKAAPVFQEGGPDLRRALEPDKLPQVTTGAAKLAADLTKDGAGLRSLVHSTSRVLTAADTANPELRTLLDGFAQTADAIAGQSENLKTTLTRFPAALRQTRTTLAGAEVTLRDAGRLTDRLRPGVAELRTTVAPLRGALAKVREVAPIGVAALDEAQGVKDIVHTLNQITSRAPLIESLAKQADKQLGCLRPYTPDIVNFGQVWGDFTNPVDTRDHLVRANVGNFLGAPMNSMPWTAGDAAKANPGLSYAFPHPPGDLAAQPWFQPQCGITEDALNPAKDPESADFVKRRNGGK